MPRSALEPCSPAARSERRETPCPDAMTAAAAACKSATRTRAGGAGNWAFLTPQGMAFGVLTGLHLSDLPGLVTSGVPG